MKHLFVILLFVALTACTIPIISGAVKPPAPSETPTPFSPPLLATPKLINPTPLRGASPFHGASPTVLSTTPFPTLVPAKITITLTDTLTFMPATPARQASETPTVSYAGCGWKWARQNLPELSAQLLSKLQGAGLPVENARAEAYGENCFAADGSIVRFSALETDFYVTLTVTDLTDESALGNLLETTLAVIDQFPIGQTPGPQPGYIGITYRSGDLVQNLWFTRIQATAIRAQGLKGADLYRALKGTP